MAELSHGSNKQSCCARFSCGGASEVGIIQGKRYKFKNDETQPLTTYFHNALHVHKKIDGEKTAIDFYDRSITFNELSTFSTAIAAQLMSTVQINSQTVEPGSDVIFAICLPVSEKLITTIFAILKTGASYLPIDAQYPKELLLRIINKFKPQVLITDENGPIQSHLGIDEGFPDTCELIILEELWLGMDLTTSRHVGVVGNRKLSVLKGITGPYPLILEKAPTTKARVAIVMPTTGVITENPKAVRISHLNIMNRLIWGWDQLPFGPKGNACLGVPVSCSESILQIFSPLLKGVTLHILSKHDTKEMSIFMNVISEKKITRIYLNPIIYEDFINEAASMNPKEVKQDLKLLKYVIVRGQLISKEATLLFVQVFPEGKYLYSFYGHPELTGDIIYEMFHGNLDIEHKYLGGRIIVGGKGKLVLNSRLYILDSHMNQVKEGEQGQICVSGLNVALGYVHNSGNGRFIPNEFNTKNDPNYSTMFCTGDYGRIIRYKDKQNRLLVEGRLDEFIYHLGFNFLMDEIRNTILAFPEVQETEMQLIHPGKYDQAVVAFIVIKKEFVDKINLGELDFRLHANLPENMLPELKLMDKIPRIDTTGRTDYAELEYQYELSRDTGIENWQELHIMSKTKADATKVLLEALYKFSSVPVTISSAAVHISAFDLGCTSNDTVNMLLYIVSKGYNISLADFLNHKSLTELVETMISTKKKKKTKHSPPERDMSNLHNQNLKELLSGYQLHLLQDRQKSQAINLIAACYCEKGILEHYNLVRYEEYVDFLRLMWDEIVANELSIACIRNSDAKLVGVIVAHDYFTDIDLDKIKGSLYHIWKFGFDIKSQFVREIPHEENNTMECVFLATLTSCKPKENVRIVALLLSSLWERGIKRQFANIYIPTCNQLVQDMCRNMLGYDTLDDFSAQDYKEIPTGKMPFHLAPNTVGVKVLLNNLNPLEQSKYPSGSHILEEEKPDS